MAEPSKVTFFCLQDTKTLENTVLLYIGNRNNPHANTTEMESGIGKLATSGYYEFSIAIRCHKCLGVQ